MTEFLRDMALPLALIDAGLVAMFWTWKGHGKPLPARLEPLRRRNRFTRWLLTRLGEPLGGF